MTIKTHSLYNVNMNNPHEHDRLTIDAVKKVSPSVVSIVISKYLPKIKNVYESPLFGGNPFGYGLPGQGLPDQEVIDGAGKEKVKIGGGSGFVVHKDGLILTNKHVVFDQEAEYTVVVGEEEEYPAKVLSRDPINDIALVQIKAKNLPAVDLGNSDKLELGQTVVAIGNSLGLFSNTVSKGIVSGLSRSISASLGNEGEMENLRGVLQTDVAINQGNSGGPLIDLEGKAIGINTAIIYGAQNIGFAIPINWAKQDLDDILKHGRIIKPYLGLIYVMLNKKMKSQYSLPVDYGALVVRDHRPHTVAVVPNSPADKAGVKENDIVVELNGEKIGKDLSDMLQKCKAGEEIELTVFRKDKELKLKTTLEERKA